MYTFKFVITSLVDIFVGVLSICHTSVKYDEFNMIYLTLVALQCLKFYSLFRSDASNIWCIYVLKIQEVLLDVDQH